MEPTISPAALPSSSYQDHMSISIMTSEPAKEESPQNQVPQDNEVQQTQQDEPCCGCKQLQQELASKFGMVMKRVEDLQTKLDGLVKEAELKKVLEASESSGKATPSSTGSRNSPKLEQAPTTPVSVTPAPIRIPPATAPASATNGSRKRKPKERTTPTVTTAASPLPDFSQFVNGFMFDPINAGNSASMMHLLSLVQQQGPSSVPQAQMQHAQSLSPPEAKTIKMEDPVISIAPFVKEEPVIEPKQEIFDADMTSESVASQTQNLLDVLTAQLNSSSSNQAAPSSTASSTAQQAVEAVATPSSSVSDDTSDPNTARCSNCRTDKTTAWRRDADGKLVCNPCGLYFRLHKVRRPIEMRKNHIQQRYRRKNKENNTSMDLNDPNLFNQLLSQMPTMTSTSGAAQPNPFSFLEQITQYTQAQELMNSSATF